MDGSKFTFKRTKQRKNIFLIDKSRKIKAQDLNKGKLDLTKCSSRVLINYFVMKYLKFSIDKLMEVIQTLMLRSVILKVILLPKNTMSAT